MRIFLIKVIICGDFPPQLSCFIEGKERGREEGEKEVEKGGKKSANKLLFSSYFFDVGLTMCSE